MLFYLTDKIVLFNVCNNMNVILKCSECVGYNQVKCLTFNYNNHETIPCVTEIITYRLVLSYF